METVRTEGVVLSETVAGKFVPAIDAHGRVLINRCHKTSLLEILVPNLNNTPFLHPYHQKSVAKETPRAASRTLLTANKKVWAS